MLSARRWRLLAALAAICAVLLLSGCTIDGPNAPGIITSNVPEGRYHPVKRMWVDDDLVMHMTYLSPEEERRSREEGEEPAGVNVVAIDMKDQNFTLENNATYRFNVDHQFPHNENLYAVAMQKYEDRYKVLVRDRGYENECGEDSGYFVYTYDRSDDATHVGKVISPFVFPFVFDSTHAYEPGYFQTGIDLDESDLCFTTKWMSTSQDVI